MSRLLGFYDTEREALEAAIVVASENAEHHAKRLEEAVRALVEFKSRLLKF